MDIVTGSIAQVNKRWYHQFLLHLGYLVHYKEYVDDLRKEMERLGKMKIDVQKSVDVARSRGEVIKEAVKEWLAKVDAIQSEMVALYNAIQDKGCLQGGWCARHHVGKKAARKIKIDVVKNLQRKGQFGAVSIQSMPTLDFQVYESTKWTMMQIMEALKEKRLDLVGIYGMAGVGKTTLMKEMARELENMGLFDHVVMVTVPQNSILMEIQRAIAENLGFEIREEDTSVRARHLLERMKQEKRIIIILDDVREALTLTKIGIPYEDRDNKGDDGREYNYSIIITTRYLEVCNQMRTQYNIEVKPLGEEDSWQLFRRSTVDRMGSLELNEVAREIVERCEGLPMAIVTIGRALRDKDQMVWFDAATQLKKSIPSTIPGMQPTVFSSIKLSYDYLESEKTQQCFLLCCLFPKESIISEDDLLPYVWGENVFKDIETIKETRNRLHMELDTLKRSCLLLNIDERRVKMHNIVRDVAVWIASEEQGFVVEAGRGPMEWPDMENLRKCKRLSLMKNEVRELPKKMPCFQLVTISLQTNSYMEIHDRCFEGMTMLKVVDLRNTRIRSIPMSLSWLTELRVLHLGIEETLTRNLDVSSLGKLKKLEILNLEGCSIRNLPEEIGGLTNLKSLNLARNYQLIIPPKVLSRLSLLEELNLHCSFDEWEPEESEDRSSASLSEVASLACLTKLWLNVSNIECLTILITLHWDNLNLTEFLVVLGKYKEKRLQSVLVVGFPRSLISEGSATKMNFINVTIPKKLSKWVVELLGRTEELLLQDCVGLKNIFPGLNDESGLNNLRSITVKRCSDLRHILRAEEEDKFPIIAFNRLEELNLDHVSDLREICHGPFLKGSLENLRCLFIRGCSHLKHIFQMNMALGLLQLEEIRIWRCCALEDIVVKNDGENAAGKAVVILPQLRVLQLIELPNLLTVCRGVSLDDFPVLQRLSIYKCPNLKMFPKSLEIEAEKTWFNDLKWDIQRAKVYRESQRENVVLVYIGTNKDGGYFTP